MRYVPKLDWAESAELKWSAPVGQQGVDFANIEGWGERVAGERGGQS
jgi:hypothetical protein